MKVLDDLKSLMELVYSNEVVLVAILGPNFQRTQSIHRILRRLEERSRGLVLTAVLHVDDAGDENVTISLFFRGVEVVRQNSMFGSEKRDYEVLKWTISHVLNSRGVETPF
ncbi:MAG: hypothetical protein QXS42_06595 [Zestosphaera sp.]